jgi:hypothetical protein
MEREREKMMSPLLGPEAWKPPAWLRTLPGKSREQWTTYTTWIAQRRSNFAIQPPSTWLTTVDAQFRHPLEVYGVLGWILRLVRIIWEQETGHADSLVILDFSPARRGHHNPHPLLLPPLPVRSYLINWMTPLGMLRPIVTNFCAAALFRSFTGVPRCAWRRRLWVVPGSRGGWGRWVQGR